MPGNLLGSLDTLLGFKPLLCAPHESRSQAPVCLSPAGCLWMLTSAAHQGGKAYSSLEQGYRVTCPAFPCFCESCDSVPFFPFCHIFCLIHVCHFHLTSPSERRRKCLHHHNIAAEFWLTVASSLAKMGCSPATGCPVLMQR